MPSRSIASFALLVGLVAGCASTSLVDTATSYHGFSIDTGTANARIDADYPALARQVAIVEAVDVPPDVHAFFRGVPIHVERNLPRPPGEFVARGGSGFVRILGDGMAADRPILLHELLHAYQAAHVSRQQAAVIDAAYEETRRSSAYPSRFRSAHFLENASEYFAVTGSIFLFGPIQQPPFDCAVLKASEPAYLAFLASRFGPHDCR